MTEERRDYILYQQYKAGFTKVYLAAKYDLTPSQVTRIIRAQKKKEAKK